VTGGISLTIDTYKDTMEEDIPVLPRSKKRQVKRKKRKFIPVKLPKEKKNK